MGSFYNCYKILVERVQCRYLNLVCRTVEGAYPERVISSRKFIASLGERKKCAHIAFWYKIWHQIDVSQIIFSLSPLTTRTCRIFYCERSRTNLYLKSPVYTRHNKFNIICNICVSMHSDT